MPGELSMDKLSALIMEVEGLLASTVPGTDVTATGHDIGKRLKIVYDELVCARAWIGMDKQRRAEERLEAAMQAERDRPREPEVHCNCYGSIFSHDADCALNIEGLRRAGYRVVRIEDE